MKSSTFFRTRFAARASRAEELESKKLSRSKSMLIIDELARCCKAIMLTVARELMSENLVVYDANRQGIFIN